MEIFLKYIVPIATFIVGIEYSKLFKISDRDLAFYPERKEIFDILDYLFNEETWYDPLPSKLKALIINGGTRSLRRDIERIFCPQICRKFSKFIDVIEEAIKSADQFDEVKFKTSEEKHYIESIRELILKNPNSKNYENELSKEREKILRHNRICSISSYYWDYWLEPLIYRLKSKS